MPHKMLVKESGEVQLRLDGAYTYNEKSLTEPNADGRYFGSFKFDEETAKEVEKILQKAKSALKLENDNIFDGEFPRWDIDEYGYFLRVSNRVVFLRDIETKEEIDRSEIRDFTFSLEVHIVKTKDGYAFFRIPRAVVLGERAEELNDELFVDMLASDDDLPF
jgi:hypothetical protein